MQGVAVAAFIAASLDGYIARPDGGLDWLPQGSGAEDDHGYTQFMRGVQALVMGRRTYETVLGFGGAWPFGKPVVVLTTGKPLRVPAGAQVEFMQGEPKDIVARLAQRGWTGLYVDGGETLTRFLAAGALQRIVVTRIPVLIGAGIPLFGPLSKDVRMRHVRTTTYPTGLVQSEYEVN